MKAWTQMAMATVAFAAFASPALADDAPTQVWSVEGNFTVDSFANVDGGIDQGSRTMDNLSLQVGFDGSAVGWEGFSASFGLLYNNAQAVNGDFVGSLQGVTNIETGVEALRPYENWIAYSWGQSAMLKAGLIDLNANFDAPDVSGLFLNPSHGINAAFAMTGENGPSIFPTLGLGFVGQVALSETSHLRYGAFDGVPGNPAEPSHTYLPWRSGEGTLHVGEWENTTEQMRIYAGAWGYSHGVDRLDGLSTGNNSGLYAGVDVHASERLGLFVRGGTADPDMNEISSYVGAGAVLTGMLPSRPNDQFGFAIAHAITSKAAHDFNGLDGAETNFEATYLVPFGDHFSVQADAQYVINPGADPSLANATVLGIRLQYSFGQ